MESAVAQIPRQGFWEDEDGETIEENCGRKEERGHDQWRHTTWYERSLSKTPGEDRPSSLCTVGGQQGVCRFLHHHKEILMAYHSAVPQAAEFLDPQPLSKGKTEKSKGKKKDANKSSAPQTLDNGFITLPAPQFSHNLSSSASPAPVGPHETSSPAPRPGFSRIGAGAVTESASGHGTPVNGDRTKVAFGFGTKRKAGDEAAGTPPPKRR